MAWSSGVCGSCQCAPFGIRSDGGLDWSSVLPSAAPHKYHQVHLPLLLQKGDVFVGSQSPTSHFIILSDKVEWKASLLEDVSPFHLSSVQTDCWTNSGVEPQMTQYLM